MGLLGLVLIAAGAGSIVYYQYVVPPQTNCGLNPVHRLIFMTALIKERGGFNIFDAATLGQTNLPSFSTTGGANLTGVSYQNYKTTDNATISGNVGDTITLYIKAISTNETGPNPQQQASATGHGFTIDTPINLISGTLPDDNLAWGTWYSITFSIQTRVSSTYHCTQFCSQQHQNMNGGFVSGCG